MTDTKTYDAPPRFERRTDDTIWALDEMPARLLVCAAAMELADPRCLCVDGDEVTITAENGRWVYRIVERDPFRETVTCALVDA